VIEFSEYMGKGNLLKESFNLHHPFQNGLQNYIGDLYFIIFPIHDQFGVPKDIWGAYRFGRTWYFHVLINPCPLISLE
jgi:hypothetical protein